MNSNKNINNDLNENNMDYMYNNINNTDNNLPLQKHFMDN